VEHACLDLLEREHPRSTTMSVYAVLVHCCVGTLKSACAAGGGGDLGRVEQRLEAVDEAALRDDLDAVLHLPSVHLGDRHRGARLLTPVEEQQVVVRRPRRQLRTTI
jgi:hypothetical protein